MIGTVIFSPSYDDPISSFRDGTDQPPPSRFDQPMVDTTNKESSDGTTQPPLLSFKSFLRDQDDNIDQEEAVKRYGVYKNDFKKTQIAEFFTAHKDEEWFVRFFR